MTRPPNEAASVRQRLGLRLILFPQTVPKTLGSVTRRNEAAN